MGCLTAPERFLTTGSTELTGITSSFFLGLAAESADAFGFDAPALTDATVFRVAPGFAVLRAFSVFPSAPSAYSAVALRLSRLRRASASHASFTFLAAAGRLLSHSADPA